MEAYPGLDIGGEGSVACIPRSSWSQLAANRPHRRSWKSIRHRIRASFQSIDRSEYVEGEEPDGLKKLADAIQ